MGGLAATGPVITTAGLIFALEFSGLLFSKTELNRQGSFVVVVGILLDTFVVRSCLTPAVLSMGASWNWWPTAMPQPFDWDSEDTLDGGGSRWSRLSSKVTEGTSEDNLALRPL